jgi:hypothetical protein
MKPICFGPIFRIQYMYNVLKITMNSSHFSKKSVHAIFSSNLSGFRKVIDLLVLCKRWINLRLNVTARPKHCELMLSFSAFYVSVIFEKVSYQFNISISIAFIKVPSILWFVWSYTYWINVWSKTHIFFKFPIENSLNLLIGLNLLLRLIFFISLNQLRIISFYYLCIVLTMIILKVFTFTIIFFILLNCLFLFFSLLLVTNRLIFLYIFKIGIFFLILVCWLF